MATRGLFPLALLYFVDQWLVSKLHKRLLQLVTNTDGEQDGELHHRFIKLERTLSGRATGVTFHYVESSAGKGKCVVFLHGFMDTWRLWRHQLTSFANRYHMVAFDLKGMGQSSMNYPQRLFPEQHDAGGDYSLAMQAEELVTALDAQGLRQFDLVTLDLGTIIGDILAGKYPERIGRYMRCQQPLVGHFRSSIPQGRILRSSRGARLLTAMLEAAPGALLRLLYGRTGWPLLDRMRRTKYPMTDAVLEDAIQQASHPFRYGPRRGRPGAFACAWAGLYQHNRDYMRYLRDNLDAYRSYTFPLLLVQGTHDHAMPPARFDGSTGMAFKVVSRPPFWRRASASPQTVLSRPFFADGRGIGDGYVPWDGLIAGCTRPLHATEFFPKARSVALKFVDSGHFVPIEAPARFNALLDEFLNA